MEADRVVGQKRAKEQDTSEAHATAPRRRGRPSINDDRAIRQMQEARQSGDAQSDWAAARIAAKSLKGHSYEADVWRLYKKYREALEPVQ